MIFFADLRLKKGLDMPKLRLLLCMQGDATKSSSSGNYTLLTRTTAAAAQAKINNFLASGGKDFEQLAILPKVSQRCVSSLTQ